MEIIKALKRLLGEGKYILPPPLLSRLQNQFIQTTQPYTQPDINI